MSGIAWLASYPKSGNTWFRSFLTAYMTGEANLSNLVGAPIAGSRQMIDKWLGRPTLGLPLPMVEALRPDAYRALAEHCRRRGQPTMIKAHDWWKRTRRGEPLFPYEATHRAILLVRDARDVACSFAHHLGKPVSEVVTHISQPNFALAVHGPATRQQVMQTLNTWSRHFTSWVDDSGLMPLVIRYEDLKKDEAAQWRLALDYLGIPYNEGRFHQAIEQVKFAKLQGKEQTQGFKEASKEADAHFFRKGEAGGWRNELTPELAAKIELNHGKVMKRLGYL